MEDDNKIAPIGFFTPQIFKAQRHTMLKKFTLKKETKDKIVPLSTLFP
jgi:hypothetical protein